MADPKYILDGLARCTQLHYCRLRLLGSALRQKTPPTGDGRARGSSPKKCIIHCTYWRLSLLVLLCYSSSWQYVHLLRHILLTFNIYLVLFFFHQMTENIFEWTELLIFMWMSFEDEKKNVLPSTAKSPLLREQNCLLWTEIMNICSGCLYTKIQSSSVLLIQQLI